MKFGTEARWRVEKYSTMDLFTKNDKIKLENHEIYIKITI